MANYYFVGTTLPSLSFDAPPEISFAQLDTLFRDNLTAKDYEKIVQIRQFYDLLNLHSLWTEEEFDPRGTLDEVALEEALVDRKGFPDYVYEFMDHYPEKKDRLHHFPLLLAKFFQTKKNLKDPFLRHFFQFERDLRLVFTAFRAKKIGRDLSLELQYENPEEDLIAQLLAQKDAQAIEPPEKYQELKLLFENYGDNPLALQKALDRFRFEKMEDFVNLGDVFSIERLLAYFTQFILVDKWFELDNAKGIKIINEILEV